MRRSAGGMARALVMLALSAPLAVVPGAAQEPAPAETVATPAASQIETDRTTAAEEPTVSDDEEEAEEPFATLRITADSSCYVYVNGEYKGAIPTPEQSLEIEVQSAVARVMASSGLVAGAIFQQEEDEALDLEEGEVREFAIPMLEAIAALRKAERRDRVWRNLDYGLMWARSDNGADVTWASARDYCQDLELGGLENWRLPTVIELETIEAIWSVSLNKITEPIFLSSCCTWSATLPADGTAYTIDYRFRRRFETNLNLAFGFRALCVRDMLAPELAEALLAADPKEQKRRLNEKLLRRQEKRRREAEKAARRAEKQPEGG